MGDETQKFEIQIVSDADLKGFEQTSGASNKLKSDTADVGKVTAQSMGMVNVSQEEVNKILGKGAEKAELSHQSMRKLAGAMNEVAGGGEFLEAAFVGMEGEQGKMMMGTFLLVGGLSLLGETLKRMSEEKQKAKEDTEKLNEADSKLTGTVEAQRQAIEEATVSEAVFAKDFLRNTQDAIDATAKLTGEILRSVSARMESSSSANKGIADAEIQSMEQRGVVSHEQAIKMKEALDIAYEQGRLQRMLATNAIEEKLMQNQLDNRHLKLHELEGNGPDSFSSAEAAAKAAAEAKAKNDARMKDAQGAIDTANAGIKDSEKFGINEENLATLKELYQNFGGKDSEHTSLSDMFSFLANDNLYTNGRMLNMFGMQGDVHLANYEGRLLDLQRGKAELSQGQNAQAGLDIAAKETAQTLALIQQTMQSTKDKIQDLQEELRVKKFTDDLNAQGAQSDLASKMGANALQTDLVTATTLARGQKVSPGDLNNLMGDAALIAGHTVNLQTAIQIIQNGANNMGIFMNQVKRLGDAFDALNPQQIQNMEAMVQRIEQTVGFFAVGSGR